MVRARFFGWMVLVAATLSGCSRVTTNTWIKADGSWTRKVRLTTSDPSMQFGEEPARNSHALIESRFKLPAEADWTITKSMKEGNPVISLIRKVPAGAPPFSDIRYAFGKEKFENRVSVQPGPDGTLVYEETFTFEEGDPRAENPLKGVAKIAGLLPEALRSDPEVEPFAKGAASDLIQLLFGPNSSALGEMLLMGDEEARVLKIQMMERIDRRMVKHFGSKISQEERNAILKELSKEWKSPASKLNASAQGGASDENPMHTYSIAVQVPGAILEHNGLLDRSENEVVWNFLPQAATIEPLKLRLVFRPNEAR